MGDTKEAIRLPESMGLSAYDVSEGPYVVAFPDGNGKLRPQRVGDRGFTTAYFLTAEMAQRELDRSPAAISGRGVKVYRITTFEVVAVEDEQRYNDLMAELQRQADKKTE